MALEDLEFAEYRQIAESIVEVTTHQGVEISGEMMRAAEKELLAHFGERPYCLLINRKNQYSHSAESMVYAAKLRNMLASAIVAYSNTTLNSAKIHVSFDSRVRTFIDRDSALQWLDSVIEAQPA